MPDKDFIAKILLESRNARLLLEMACWIHDLDKASWPFACFKMEQRAKDKDSEHYSHDKQPERSKDPSNWKWDSDWLGGTVIDGPAFDQLIYDRNANVDLKFYDPKDRKDYSFTIQPRVNSRPVGNYSSLFNFHSAWNIEEQPWEPLIISTPFGGPDGIDSEFFKGGLEAGQSGQFQTKMPPMVATPFGFEQPVIGCSADFNEFKKKNKESFDEIWKIAFDWIKNHGKPEEIPEHWSRIRSQLRDKLKLALGYSNRPTNDVNLWDHSYGVGAMAKALAASLCLDASAAKSKNKTLLFPIRSPERNLRPLKTSLNVPDYLPSEGLKPDNFEGLERQVQTKFKVLSVLLRDTNHLHVGRKVGDILGYHKRRDNLFEALATVLEKDLAVGAEIFRDHEGIHFILPWCQDSLDAHLKEGETPSSNAHPCTQEILEEMIKEVVNCIFLGSGEPSWIKNNSINIGAEKDRKTCDFEAIVRIGPIREPLLDQLGKEPGKTLSQGLLFLKNNTFLTERLDRDQPKPFPPISTKGESEAGNQLCPICRKRPVARKAKGANENDTPCQVCKDRREFRANIWWQRLCEFSSLPHTTIWASEASDQSSRVNLLTIAFDLRRWFNGSGFAGYWMDTTDQNFPYLPVYPAPGRIRGVWEASLTFIKDLHGQLKVKLGKQSRLVFKITGGPSLTIDNGKGVLLTPKEKDPTLGDWFLGRDGEGQCYLLSVSGWDYKKDEEGIECLIFPDGQRIKFDKDQLNKLVARIKELTYQSKDGSVVSPLGQITNFEKLDSGDSFLTYIPLIDILIDSPTRFQVLAPGRKTIPILKLINELFIKHFGKVAHNMTVCVHNLTFKEKFPFYLALEAADRFINLELERAAFKKRKGTMSRLGLEVNLDEDDPARNFLGENYSWRCLDPENRDLYRSTVALKDFDDKKGLGPFLGWGDLNNKEKSESALMKIERLRFQPELDSNFQPNPLSPVIKRENYNDGDSYSGIIQCSCPRLSWAHLASPGERDREQLSIPLLAFHDWLGIFEVLTRGTSDLTCRDCWKSIEGNNKAPLPEKAKDLQLKGLGKKPTQLRNLFEEILNAHTLWPAGLGNEEKTRQQVLQSHIQALLCHPNSFRNAWRKWSELKDEELKCPLVEVLGESKKESCLKIIKKIFESVIRFEEMARSHPESLIVTFDLLSRVCSYNLER